jgi:hypothetical protein
MGFVPIGGWGPQGLIDKGWIFQNNSQPPGPVGWVSGCCWGAVIQPLSGTGYLASYQDAAAGGAPQYSNWAILPAVAEQQAGDVFGFYTISSDTSPFDNVSLQVRYSPSGGTSVGVGAADVGDFTQVLLDITTMPNYNSGTANGWTYWEFTLPGPGRIALRQYGGSSLYFGVEDVTIGHPVPQANFPEDFENLGGLCGEGPCALIANGWSFVDQSTPATAAAWEPNQPLDPLDPHSGFGFMKSVSAAGGGFQGGGVNNWAILPAEGLGAGAVLNFFATGSLGEGGTLQVRYSPSGAIGTGSGLSGVGDFTQVLVSVSGLVFGSWQPVTVTVPGDGRVAIRFHNPSIPGFSGSRVAAVDSMTVDDVPAGPPLPQPGETVAWTAGMSPITIDTDLVIAAGATLHIEPGVTIAFTTGHSLSVAGSLYATGTEANPITMSGWAPSFPALLDAGGHTELTHVHMESGRFEATFATDCTAADSVLDARRVQGCILTDSSVSVVDGVLAVEDSSLTGGGISLLRGYLHVNNVQIDGASVSLSREDASHTVYLNTIAITNSPGPAFVLGGFGFFLGSENELSGNLYPARLSGGLAPGSTVPVAGNANNFVHLANDNSPTGHDELPPLPVPYLLTGSYVPGLGLEVLPGAEFVGVPGGQLWEQFHGMRLMGLPEQPIRFRGASSFPGAWHGIQWSLVEGSRAEYCIVEDAQFGMLVDESIVPIENCLLQGNAYGSRTTNYGISLLRKNQFLGNQVGVSGSPTGSFDLYGQANPNAIAGNGAGVVEDDPQDSPEARFNWWGHASGPTTPDNPAGQGDTAGANVSVIPFLTAAPDFADTPPVVRLQETARVFETGAPLILHWDASDDSAIVSQRVLFHELGLPDDDETIVLHEGLPPGQRSALVTVPASTFFHRGSFIVQAIDDAGQVGSDSRSGPILADTSGLPGDFSFPAGLEGPFATGQALPDFPYVAGTTYAILLEDMNESIDLGAGVTSAVAPYASTDTARIVAVTGSGKRHHSAYFAVRPPAYVGDAAPALDLTAPAGGAFAGGSTVTVAWSASDDEAIRGFDLQASYDGGRTWHFVRRRIPATVTSFAWTLPPLDRGLPGVRLRVVAWDLRFGSSSDTATIDLSPGGFGGNPADANGDGVVNVSDMVLVVLSWGACPGLPCAADVTGDGVVDVADLVAVVLAWQ